MGVSITPRTTVVNINRQVVDANSKRMKADPQALAEPPIRVSRGKAGRASYGHEVAVLDAAGNEVARFIYDPHNKVAACGARIVLVAHHGARVVG